MLPISLKVVPLQIPMRHKFKHSSAERNISESIWVEVSDGISIGLGEGCPREYVTGETLSKSIDWIKAIFPKVLSHVECADDLKEFVIDHEKDIDSFPSAWCALETALLDYLGKIQKKSIEDLLLISNVSTKEFRYTAVLSDSEINDFEKTLSKYLNFGFWDFKIKLNGNLQIDLEKLSTFNDLTMRSYFWKFSQYFIHFLQKYSRPDFRIRMDANNFWKNDTQTCITYLETLKRHLETSFLGIEEPIDVGNYEELYKISRSLNIPIILDESFLNHNHINQMEKFQGIWIPNVRVSKQGGIIRTLQHIDRIKKNKWKAIVGAQVGETSVLTRLAMIAANELGSNLEAHEGGFGTRLISDDPVSPVQMWNLAGRLKPSFKSFGLGLTKNKEMDS